ncbi:TIGR00297 family protein [Methanothermococcus sp.]|uniref:TIGR00297 family protein n=1 Tax=Methanothermococcus sp. TaxID=2614238 RepID=UPI0025FCFD9D|nr:TIGR00297 family protein [Methanothermococcus sp.]
MDIYMKFISSLIIVLVLAYAIKKKGFLDNCGILCSSAMAFIILMGTNLNWLIIMVCFLVFGSLVSKVGYSKKNCMGMGECKRTIKNVLANGALAVLIVLLYIFGIIDYNIALFGYIGSISAATSDTFSSELGVLSNETPRLITTLEKVEKGTDGGVSIYGTFAGIVGAFLIGLISSILFNNYNLIWIGTISGIVGNLSDSLFGALLERRGIFNNEHVNFTCTLMGSLCAIMLYLTVIH